MAMIGVIKIQLLKRLLEIGGYVLRQERHVGLEVVHHGVLQLFLHCRGAGHLKHIFGLCVSEGLAGPAFAMASMAGTPVFGALEAAGAGEVLEGACWARTVPARRKQLSASEALRMNTPMKK